MHKLAVFREEVKIPIGDVSLQGEVAIPVGATGGVAALHELFFGLGIMWELNTLLIAIDSWVCSCADIGDSSIPGIGRRASNGMYRRKKGWGS